MTIQDDEDPVLFTFLNFLEKEMTAHPDQIIPADQAQLERIQKLVDGVETD